MDAEGSTDMQNATKNCRTFPSSKTAGETEVLEPRILNDRKEAASQLSISVRSLDYLISSGRIHTRRIGGRVLVPTRELRRFATDDRDEPLVPVLVTKAA